MALFFVKTKDEAISKLFSEMILKGVEHGYNVNINALLWSYKKKKDIYCVYYSGIISIFIFNWLYYFFFKLALKFRYKEKCRKVGNIEGIKTFIEL